MELDQLKDFNEVIAYYKEILTFLIKIDVKSDNAFQVINNHFLKDNRITNRIGGLYKQFT